MLEPQRDLATLERIIESGLNTFVEVGTALLEIRDGRLYQAEGYTRFEDYCQQRWQMSRSRAYQLIEAAEVTRGVSTIVDTPPPANEAQARELARIPDAETRQEVWAELTADDDYRMTAARIREAADRRQAAAEILRDLPPVTEPRERKIFMRLSGHYHYVEVDPEAVAAQCVLLSHGGQGLATDASMLEAYAAWVVRVATAIRGHIARPLRRVEEE